MLTAGVMFRGESCYCYMAVLHGGRLAKTKALEGRLPIIEPSQDGSFILVTFVLENIANLFSLKSLTLNLPK